MAYANYKCKCGKTLSIFGKGIANAEEKAKWAEGRIFCDDCRVADAAAQSQAHNLPNLTGSSKQIAWATEIREAAIDALPRAADMIQMPGQLSAEAEAEMRTALRLVARELLETKSAAWWIEHRYGPWQGLIKKELNRRAAELAPNATAELVAQRLQKGGQNNG